MKKYSLIYTLSVILVIGFLATSLMSYFVSKSSIRSAVINYELPLITSDIYAEIQKELVRPVFVSSMMAKDRFLRDWVINGEHNQARIQAYLHDVQANNKNARLSYFISEATRKYYYSDGSTRFIQEKSPADAWYFRFRDGGREYVLNIDTDVRSPDVYVLYVDHKVVDDNGKFIGIAGNGIALDYLKNIIKSYQSRYKRSVYFVDKKGQIRLSDGKEKPIGQHIQSFTGDALLRDILAHKDKPAGQLLDHHHEYRYQGNTFLLHVKYVPELEWFLVVEKNEAQTPALQENKKTLFINLGLCALVTGIALLLTQASIKRYQSQIERLATTDNLTDLPNRSAFDLMINNFLSDSLRHQQAVSLVLFDLDEFKKINDSCGHNAGDKVLKEVARALSAHVRTADFFCRWGGEEFLVLLKDCDNNNAQKIAENFRQVIEKMTVDYNGKPIQFTGSFGVATLKKDNAQKNETHKNESHKNETIEQLIFRADANLYAAKNAGRNRVVVTA